METRAKSAPLLLFASSLASRVSRLPALLPTMHERFTRLLTDLATHGQSSKEEISKRIDVPVDTLRRHLADLRKDGHIQRHSDVEDPRRVSFSISPAGRKALKPSKARK